MLAQDAADGLSWAQVLTAATQVTVLIGAIGTGLGFLYVKLRRWVQRAAAESKAETRQVRDQVAVSNGHKLGELAEATAADVRTLRTMADANRARVDALDARLDRHIIAGHRAE